jgi:hypothetical protein
VFVNSLMLQCQFRFDNECNLSLPDNHKRVSESSQSSQQTCMPDHTLLSVSMLLHLFHILVLLLHEVDYKNLFVLMSVVFQCVRVFCHLYYDSVLKFHIQPTVVKSLEFFTAVNSCNSAKY